MVIIIFYSILRYVSNSHITNSHITTHLLRTAKQAFNDKNIMFERKKTFGHSKV